jgi:hypothetical protein
LFRVAASNPAPANKNPKAVLYCIGTKEAETQGDSVLNFTDA